jgi:hypothetical protein
VIDDIFGATDCALPAVRLRKFHTTTVKAVIREFYGARPGAGAWRNWRAWGRQVAAQMADNLATKPTGHVYSFQELCAIAAIACLRRNDGPRRYELNGRSIKAQAEAPEFQEKMAGLITAIDRTHVVGAEAYLALRPHGIDVSYRTVARKVPDFSARRIYLIKDLIKAIG